MTTSHVDPHLFIVFGGAGDLMGRKLLPALYRIGQSHGLGDNTAILGVAVSHREEKDYRAWARKSLEEEGATDLSTGCDECLFYETLGAGTDEDFRRLADRIAEIEKARGLTGNRVFYLALPPSAFAETVHRLGEAGLAQGAGWTRLVIEKPFGRDLKSAHELNDSIHEVFQESQVYRIDHYLGKETVQNLLVFRFANPIFESVWNRDRIQSVHITVAESLGVEARAKYYERAGALRDMVQNHVSQLVSLIGMEIPAAFDAQAVRYEKIKLLSSISPLGPDDVVFGQYAAGKIDGQPVPGYRDEPDVRPGSETETFVAARLRLETWRWQGVPFYIRTGKRLATRRTWISIRFAKPPVHFFESLGCCQPRGNELVLTLQPDEGFALHFDVKAPTEPLQLRQMPLSFRYREAFGRLPEAYETLLLDILIGDQTLFVHADEAEQSWKLFGPLLENPPPLRMYEAGSWGPHEADEMLAASGDEWHDSAQ